MGNGQMWQSANDIPTFIERARRKNDVLLTCNKPFYCLYKADFWASQWPEGCVIRETLPQEAK